MRKPGDEGYMGPSLIPRLSLPEVELVLSVSQGMRLVEVNANSCINRLSGFQISPATNGNILEALNLAVNGEQSNK